ncbi:hypothetical protein LX32DRAFT_636049, partial [Colletotrichum zoysiae]
MSLSSIPNPSDGRWPICLAGLTITSTYLQLGIRVALLEGRVSSRLSTVQLPRYLDLGSILDAVIVARPGPTRRSPLRSVGFPILDASAPRCMLTASLSHKESDHADDGL